MSLDDLPPLVAHRRLRDDYDRQDEQEWLVEQSIAENEENGGYWQRVMDAAPEHRRREVWPDRPAVDRRCFSVEGEIPEQARRDALYLDIPSDAA